MVTWDTPGNYEVTLTVGDGTGSTTTLMYVITAVQKLHRLEIDSARDYFLEKSMFADLIAYEHTL